MNRRLLISSSRLGISILTMTLALGAVGCGGSSTTEPPAPAPATTGASWQWAHPVPTGGTLQAVAYNSESGIYTAVGERGTILTSPDKLNWTLQDSGSTVNLNAVAAIGGSALLAVGDDGTILVGSTEALWRKVASGVTADLRGIAWDGTNTVIVGDAGTILSSNDGTNWTLQPGQPELGNLMAVAGNGVFFVTVDDEGHIATSPNLSSWSLEPAPLVVPLLAVTWRASRFLVTGEQGTIFTSTDGVNWTQRTSGTSAHLTGAAGLAGGTVLAVVGRFSTAGNVVLTSSDLGITWTSQDTGHSSRLTGLTDDGSTFLAVGFGGTLLTSGDGATWSASLPTQGLTEDRLQAVAWSGSLFAVAGAYANGLPNVLTSPDGMTWSAQEATSGPTTCVRWDGSQFFGLDSTRFVSSTDGLTWQGTEMGIGTPPNSVVHAGGRYVAVGGAGSIASSADGITWNLESSGSSAYLNAVAGNGTTFVAVGDNGAFLIGDQQGQSWSAPTVAGLGSTSLFDVTWSGTRFVAVGDHGTVLTSDLGTSWNLNQVAGVERIRGVNWDGQQFVAVGDAVVLTSSDAVTWTVRDPGTEAVLTSVAGNTDLAVAVGWDGAIIRSTSAQ